MSVSERLNLSMSVVVELLRQAVIHSLDHTQRLDNFC